MLLLVSTQLTKMNWLLLLLAATGMGGGVWRVSAYTVLPPLWNGYSSAIARNASTAITIIGRTRRNAASPKRSVATYSLDSMTVLHLNALKSDAPPQLCAVSAEVPTPYGGV